jgi:hypothetical protein
MLSETVYAAPRFIEGTVTRGDDRAAPVAATDVRIVAFSDTAADVVASGKTDMLGKFRVPAPPADTTTRFLRAEASYAGLWQPGQAFVGPQSDLFLSVSDTTSSTAEVSVEKLHVIVNPMEAGLGVTSIFILRNSGGIYIGEPPAAAGVPRIALKFLLPPEAQNVQIMEGSAAAHRVPAPWGFGSPLPFYPGVDTLVFGYTIPWDGKRVSFVTQSPYPIQSLSVITMARQLELDVEGAERVPAEEAPDLAAYGRRLVPANTPVEIDVASAGAGRHSLAWFIVGGIGVALLLVALGFMVRARRSASAGGSRQKQAPVGVDADRLVDEIAQLDDDFEAGKLAEDEYATRRRELKGRLVQALREEKGSG